MRQIPGMLVCAACALTAVATAAVATVSISGPSDAQCEGRAAGSVPTATSAAGIAAGAGVGASCSGAPATALRPASGASTQRAQLKNSTLANTST